MREDKWLVSDRPDEMLNKITAVSPMVNPLGRSPSDRKLRLFMCACCQQVWSHITNERDRKAIATGEQFADGEVANMDIGWFTGTGCCNDPAAEGVERALNYSARLGLTPATQADILREIVGNPYRPLTLPKSPEKCRFCGGKGWRANTGTSGPDYVDCGCKDGMARTGPCPWLTPLVLSLATAAYEERPGRKCGKCVWIPGVLTDGAGGSREVCHDCHGTGRIQDGTLDPANLAVLADALEEAGCPSEVECGECPQLERARVTAGGYYDRDMVREVIEWGKRKRACRCGGAGRLPHPVIAHLRSPGPHVRGMWSLDLLLGKE